MNVNQRDFALRTAAEGDAAKYSRDHSLICSLPRLQPGQRFLQTKSHACKAQEDKLNPYRRSEASKVKLPPIRDTGRPKDQSSNCIKELKNQNSILLQQLKESKSENKLLKNVLHRHTVALQQFQDLEGSISQIQDQHRNEVKALRKLLGETRLSRDRLAKKLQATEKELLDAKDRIQTLQWRVIQNPNLLEKEELTYRLNEITLQLEEKDKRIQFLEKSNMLLQGSLNRHVAIEQRKLYKTNDMSVGLQAQVNELAKKTQARMRESQTSISAIRSRKQLHKKGKQNKMVQTDEFISPCSDADSRLKSDFSESDDMLQPCQSPVTPEYVPKESQTSKRRKYINDATKYEVSASQDVPHQAPRRQVLGEESAMEECKDEAEVEEKQKERNRGQGDQNEEEEEEVEVKQKERNRGQGDQNEEEDDEEVTHEMNREQEDKNEEEEEDKLQERNRELEVENEEEEEEEEEENVEMEDEEDERSEEHGGVAKGGKEETEELEEENEKQEEEKDEEEEDADEKEERSLEERLLEQFKKIREDVYDDEENDIDEYEEEEEEEEEDDKEENGAEKEHEEEEEKAEGKDMEELEEDDDNDKKVDDESEDEDENEKEEYDEENEGKEEEEQDEEVWTSSRQSSVSCIANEPKLTPREPKRCSKPKLRRKYNFNPVTTNLHLGKPAYTGVQLRYYKGANVPVREETLYCRNRKRSIELLEDASLSDEQTSQPDATSDGSDLESKNNESCSWT